MGSLNRQSWKPRKCQWEAAIPTQQGSLDLLYDPVAQKLLQSSLPARLAYNWTDGTPRLSPVWFHWNGSELVFGGPPNAPKMQALPDGTRVAVTMNTDTMPYKVLAIRSELFEGVPPEYDDAAKRALGDDGGAAWVETIGHAFPTMARLFVRPEWVGILDFEHRFPNEVERAMERMQAQASTLAGDVSQA